jgi:hypothetical protein
VLDSSCNFKKFIIQGYASTVTNNLDNELLTPLCALLNSANCSGVMFVGSITAVALERASITAVSVFFQIQLRLLPYLLNYQ